MEYKKDYKMWGRNRKMKRGEKEMGMCERGVKVGERRLKGEKSERDCDGIGGGKEGKKQMRLRESRGTETDERG